jgi:hypothetical protein
MKNQRGSMRKKNHIGKKIISQLSACDVTRVVSLDTNNQAYVYEESGELLEICNLLLLLLVDLLITWFLCCCVNLLFLDLIFKWLLLFGYLSFSICSALNPDCLFIRL